jgi:rhodanese-related sulfurtransferase
MPSGLPLHFYTFESPPMFLRRHFFITTLTAALAAVPVVALALDKPDTPTTLKGGTVVDLPALRALMAKGPVVLVDTRSPLNFGKGHVPGALSIGYKELSAYSENFDASVDSFDTKRLPQDKDTALVFYSDGPSGWKSYKAAVISVAQGYKRVHYFRAGWPAWQEGLAAQTAQTTQTAQSAPTAASTKPR